METGFITVFWYFVIAAAIVPLMLGAGWLLRPKSRYIGKAGAAYECGEDPVGSPWVKFNIRFYVIAIVFIIFDVEMVAIFPVATLFKDAALKGTAGLIFAEIFLFVGLLVAGLIFCWVRGDLDWVKGVSGPRLRSPNKNRKSEVKGNA